MPVFIFQCSLHYLLSSTVDNRVRGDETTTCSRSSRYTSRILRRKREGEDGTELPVIPELPEVESNSGDGNNIQLFTLPANIW